MPTFRSTSWWFGGMLAAALVAFWPRYLSRLGEPIDRYTHWHALVAVTWCLGLVVQPLLVRREQRHLHRLVGKASYLVAPLFVATAVLLASQRFRAMDEATFAAEAPSLFLPLSAAFLFAWAWAWGIAYRRRVALHARCMIITGLVAIDPILGRLLFFFLPPFPHPLGYQAVTFGLVSAVVAWLALGLAFPDARQRRTFLGIAAVVPVTYALWFTLAQGARWMPFARWFRELPLT